MRIKQVIALALAIAMMVTVFVPVASAAGSEQGIDLSATVLEPKPEVGITVDTNHINFGELLPGETSDSHDVTATNVGLKPIEVTMDVQDDGNGVFEQGVEIDENAWGDCYSHLGCDQSDSFGVALHVPDDAAVRGSISGSMTLFAQAVNTPVAEFSANVTSGIAPLDVQFTDLSANGPTSWAWDFNNDGTVDSTIQNPAYTYSAAGTYDVKLTVSNFAGSDDEVKTAYIVVSVGVAPASDFIYESDGSSITITGYQGPGGDVIIPGTIDGLPVTSIGSGAFQYRSGLTSIVIPDGVTYIGAWSFGGCQGLTSVTIPNSVTTIDYSAFRECSGLTSLTIPGSVTYIEDAAFMDCTGLTTLLFNGNAPSVGGGFSYCPALTVYYFESATGFTTPTWNGVPCYPMAATAPLAAFDADITVGGTPLTVSFEDRSIGTAATAWQWDFDNDGVVDSTEQDPSFTYTAPGIYTVKLTVSNAGGSDDEVRSGYVAVAALNTVYNDPADDALASIELSTIRMGAVADRLIVEVEARQTINFMALSFDTDMNADTGDDGWGYVTGIHDVLGAELELRYSPGQRWCNGYVYHTDENGGGTSGWSITVGNCSNHGSIYVFQIPFSLLSSSIEFNFGAYTETDDGVSGWYDLAPNIGVVHCALLAPAPSADFSADVTSGIEPLTVQFTDLSSNGPTAWSWDFDGDGVVDSIAQNPSYTYAAPGTFTVTLTASSIAGTDTEVKAGYIVTVLPTEAPVADFSASTTSGIAPLTVHFTDLSTNSPTSWAWDFDNDGVVDSTDKNPVWAYETPDTYTVNLTAGNVIGSSDAVKEYYIAVIGGESWTLFHGNQQLTGYSGYDAPDTNNTLWISEALGASKSSSVVIGEGKIFVYCLTGGMGYGDPQGYIAALNLYTGALLWIEPTIIDNPYASWASPAYADGLVFTPGDVARHASDGSPAWADGRYLPDNTNGGPMVANGKVYSGNWDGNTYFCFDELTGEQQWALPVNGYAQGTPAYYHGMLFLTSWAYGGSPAGTLYCVNANTGAVLWTANSDSSALNFCGSACVADGYVFVTAYNFYGNGAVFCFQQSDGALVWQKTIERTDSTPAYHDGKLYVTGGCAGFSPHQTYCFDAANGDLLWNTTKEQDIGGWTCSVVVADGKVFVGQEASGGTSFSSFGYQKLFALDPADGSIVWSYDGCGSTVATYDGVLYSAGVDGCIYAFAPPPAPVAGFQATVPVDQWGYLSDTATFSDASENMNPGMTTLHWHWDFGDGTSADYDGTMLAQISHGYADADGWQDQYFTVTLTVTNDYGTDSHSEVVHIYSWW